MKININSLCTVKLTTHGKVRIWEYLSKVFSNDLKQIPQQYEIMASGNHVWHLHELANVFGPELYMGNPHMPFESDIEFILKDEPHV